MERSIKSVEVIQNGEPIYYAVGQEVSFDGPVIADVVEVNNAFFFYDKEDNLLMEVRNCPVVVMYKYEESEGK